MGNKVTSMVSRQVKRFNVENRAHSLIEKQMKPTAAPKYEGNLRDMQRTLEVDPQFIEKLHKKDSELDNRLKNVYVTSKENQMEYNRKEDPNKPLPADRSAVEFFEYGYKEPDRVTAGRCSLRQAMEFIVNHQQDPDQWTIEKIAQKYKLKERNVDNIVKYFRSFDIYIPDKENKQDLVDQFKAKLLSDKDASK